MFFFKLPEPGFSVCALALCFCFGGLLFFAALPFFKDSYGFAGRFFRLAGNRHLDVQLGFPDGFTLFCLIG